VPQLRPSGQAYGRHDHAGHQAAADVLVSGLLPDRPGKDGHLLSGTQPPLGRELRHRLAAAQQDPAGDDREGGVLRAVGKILMNDAYLGGERPGGKAGRGSENKIQIVAAVRPVFRFTPGSRT